jgi:predicted oxidoreductase
LRRALASLGEELGTASLDQVALAWILKHPARIVPVLGSGRLGRIHSAAEAEAVQLSREEWFAIWTASAGEEVP